MKRATLEHLLDSRRLRRLAGAQSFERGEDYFANRQVRSLVEHDGAISAKVQGTEVYRVRLWAEADALEYSCSCPIGSDESFCKHCVAVALAWLDQAKAATPAGRKDGKRSVTIDDVREHLLGQEKTVLVDLLMEQALEDDTLRRQLLVRAARKTSSGVSIATFRRVIDEAVDHAGFVDYRGTGAYLRGIDDAVDAIEDLLKQGHAAEVIELAEHALESVEDAMASVDDSDGLLGEVLARLQELHHEACRKSKPDPKELAERLFEWETDTDYDIFYGAAATYADVLGKSGLAVYRRLAEREWKNVPALAPGKDDPDHYGRRFKITQIMEGLARESGNVEALVEVLKRDLSLPHGYLEIAEAYNRARKIDLAIEWAERGVKAFPQRSDPRLSEFLANAYHSKDRHDDAMNVVWAEFAGGPVFEQYKTLKAHAVRAGQWPAWREKALGFIRAAIAKAKHDAQKQRWHWSAASNHSELVEIFLWERDIDAAWREANEGGCSDRLWIALAAKREAEQPADAVAVYQNQVEPALKRTNNDAYKEVVEYLRKIRRLMLRLGRASDFDDYLACLRAEHKPKRNFIKLLDGARWS